MIRELVTPILSNNIPPSKLPSNENIANNEPIVPIK